MPSLLKQIQEVIPDDAMVSDEAIPSDDEGDLVDEADDTLDYDSDSDNENKRTPSENHMSDETPTIDFAKDTFAALASDSDDDTEDTPEHRLVKARDNLDLYYNELKNDKRKLAEFNNNLLSICEKYCEEFKKFSIDLSSSDLQIEEKDKASFYSCHGQKVYEKVIHLLQTIMAEKYLVHKFGGKQLDHYVGDNDEGVYICLYDVHSKMYTLSKTKRLSFEAEADTVDLKPTLKEWGDVCRNALNQFKKSHPEARIFKVEVTPAELKRACMQIVAMPDEKLVDVKKDKLSDSKKTDKIKVGWGKELYGNKVPSRRNCHAFVYLTLRKVFQKRIHDKIKSTFLSKQSVYNSAITPSKSLGKKIRK